MNPRLLRQVSKAPNEESCLVVDSNKLVLSAKDNLSSFELFLGDLDLVVVLFLLDILHALLDVRRIENSQELDIWKVNGKPLSAVRKLKFAIGDLVKLELTDCLEPFSTVDLLKFEDEVLAV